MRNNKKSGTGHIVNWAKALLILSLLAVAGCSKTDPMARPTGVEPELDTSARLAERAAAGDALAQLELGNAYAGGIGVPKDDSLAAEWWQRAADQHSADAQMQLARAYGEGRGVPQDDQKVRSFLKASAEGGNREAQVAHGLELVGDGRAADIKEGVDWIKRAADAGDARGQFVFGSFHLEQGNALGEGAPGHSDEIALLWITKAAEQGLWAAQTSLIRAYERGTYVEKDERKHIYWLERSAEQGDSISQWRLAQMYYEGSGLPRNDAKAIELWRKVAEKGEATAEISQIALASAVLEGRGAGLDPIVAYAWANIAAGRADSDDIFDARKVRDLLGRSLTDAERSEGERLSASWTPGSAITREGQGGSQSGASSAGNLRKQGTGTAFFVSALGHALTNNHVVAGCGEVRLESSKDALSVLAVDPANDLALIRVERDAGEAATLSDAAVAVEQGEEVVVFGFPLNAVLSSGGNLTPGVVSALTGLGNNTSEIQITAPIQPGSSGSPVFNRRGQVVGIVSAKISDEDMVRQTGQIAQNVNFAVSVQNLRTFLVANRVEFSSRGRLAFKKSPTAIADQAREFTFVVECWK